MERLPPFVTRDLVGERLRLIFPEGTPNRNYCIRELAASTVFVALYIGAVESAARFLAPIHVYRMTREHAVKGDDPDRREYAESIAKKQPVHGVRWYADNTREPIRDETLRDGLVAIGAVIQRRDMPTTSSLPRYALKADFAALFDPSLQGPALSEAIESFQRSHLSASALARVRIMAAGAAGMQSDVLVMFPNKETRRLAPGPSSSIAKAVVEVFAPRFLERPAVLWLSESGNKIVLRDDQIANSIGLKIDASRNLPDMILADLGPANPLIIFVEIVATDGAMTELRKEAIWRLTDDAGFDRKHVAFLTAYSDRQSSGFRRTVPRIAWGTFAWFASEPEHIVILRSGSCHGRSLAELIGS